MAEFDLIIIGGGGGGFAAASNALEGTNKSIVYFLESILALSYDIYGSGKRDLS